MKKRIIVSISAVIVLIGLTAGAIYFDQASHSSAVQVKPAATATAAKSLTYKGQTGQTALALLQQKTKIETSGTGTNAFVTSIGGLKADSKKEFWSLAINGTDATVGAGSYVTKDSESITWTLTAFK